MMQRNQDEFGEVTEVGNDTSPPQQQDEEHARIETSPTLLAAPRKPEEDPHHFPTKLHRMLVDIDDNPKYESMKELISWQPHGRCFIIRNEKKFIEKVMPHFFRVIKFSSFRRQLHLFGFRKLSRQGPDKGAYFHELFVKDKPEMAAQMRPVKGQGKRGRKPRSEDLDAAFYARKSLSLAASNLRGNNEGMAHQEFKQPEGSSMDKLRPDGPSLQRMAATSFLQNDAFASGFQNSVELRQLESLSGQIPNSSTMDHRQLESLSGQAPHYQHQQNQMPFPSGVDSRPSQPAMGGLTLPNSFLPSVDGSNVDPFAMQQQAGFGAGFAGPASTGNFLRQSMPQQSQLALESTQQQQLQDGMMNASFDPQQQSQMQMQQQFDQQQLQQQRLAMQAPMMGANNAMNAQNLPFQQAGMGFDDTQGQQQMFLQQQQQQMQHQMQMQMQQQMQQQFGMQQQQQQQGSMAQNMFQQQQNHLLQQQNQQMLQQMQQQPNLFGLNNNNNNSQGGFFGNNDQQGNPNFQPSNFHDSNSSNSM